jgi:hypothetical protein
MSPKRTAILAAVITTFLILAPSLAGAQTPGQSTVHIHEVPEPQQVTTVAGTVGLSLQPSFSLLDANNQVLTSFEITDASIQIGSASYAAVVKELETPWTIVVLADTSKIMGGFSAITDFRTAKTALANAIGSVPDQTSIAILTFADTAPTILDFTQAKDSAATKLKNLTARATGNSCFYSGLYEAVNKLSPAPGRRAVIAFTASDDNCATKTPQDVVSLAQKSQVQIYAVGLQGYTITEETLKSVALPTGGLAEFRDAANLNFGLSNVFAIFKNQWTATATVYPSAGPQSAVLTVNLKDGTSLKSAPFTFTSSQDYVAPAQIHLKGKVQSTGDGIIFNLDLVQPQTIRQLNVTIISKDTGQSVLSQSLLNFSDVNAMPAVGLSAGLEYTLNVAAVDSNGQVISQDTADFKYEPPQASVSVTDVQTPTVDSDQFVVKVTAQNVTGAVKYKAWLADQQTSAKIQGTEVTVPLGDPIIIPSAGVRSGTYAVIVQALDSSDNVLAVSPAYGMTYKPIGAFERFRSWVSRSPLAIAGMTGLCCLTVLGLIGVVWVMMPKRREMKSGVDLVLPDKARRQAPPSPRVVAPPQPPRAGRPAAPPHPPARGVAAPPAAPVAAPVAVPGAQVIAAKLTLLFPASPPYSVVMRRSPFTVGRRKENDVPLPVDSSSGVSGVHMTLMYERGAYFVLDQGSKFGTSINGNAIVKGEPTQLKDGDQIGLGPIVKIEFRILAG